MAQIITALSTEVGDGVQVRYTLHQRSLHFLTFFALRRVVLQGRELCFQLNGLDDEPPGLLLDVNQFSNVLVFEARPGSIQGIQDCTKFGSRRMSGSGTVRAGTRLNHERQLRPSLLQCLSMANRLGAQLKLVAVHPNGRVLVRAGLEHVDTIVSSVVWEECTVVGRKLLAVATWGSLQSKGFSCGFYRAQKDRACTIASFATHLGTSSV
mmetsp:Transcript_8139/g.14830  ORF Transcript_8139/g.14830 Transcript_8139/m.14830 type:complete len:210 (+) Transcript_8139:407-1036(+)